MYTKCTDLFLQNHAYTCRLIRISNLLLSLHTPKFLMCSNRYRSNKYFLTFQLWNKSVNQIDPMQKITENKV